MCIAAAATAWTHTCDFSLNANFGDDAYFGTLEERC